MGSNKSDARLRPRSSSGKASMQEPSGWRSRKPSPLMAVATLYRNVQTVPRMEPIEYPSLGFLIPGRMSLLRLAFRADHTAIGTGHLRLRSSLSSGVPSDERRKLST
jgi:hypothetical protein